MAQTFAPASDRPNGCEHPRGGPANRKFARVRPRMDAPERDDGAGNEAGYVGRRRCQALSFAGRSGNVRRGCDEGDDGGERGLRVRLLRREKEGRTEALAPPQRERPTANPVIRRRSKGCSLIMNVGPTTSLDPCMRSFTGSSTGCRIKATRADAISQIAVSPSALDFSPKHPLPSLLLSRY